ALLRRRVAPRGVAALDLREPREAARSRRLAGDAAPCRRRALTHDRRPGSAPMSLNFAEILAPHGISGFLADFWEREVLHIRRDAPDFYARLMTRGDVERLLLSGRRGAADTRLSMRGLRVGAEHYTDAEGSSMRAVYKLY